MATKEDKYAKVEKLNKMLAELDSKHDMYKQHLNQAALEQNADKKKEIEDLAQKYYDEYKELFERVSLLLCEVTKLPERSEDAISTKTLAPDREAGTDESDSSF